ncbi:M14 family zinc carboxypeptidase [Lentibacillus sp. CBA3610]|uniref:M14 family zinc carboxypeptidase n=1 Tax=Lentibacillus sp. CBA3610 TaxID=2518176 RepID=UPI00159503DE|nr:M14 family zinc carboxypeptidase [Lentibacillus sp. CBA3610]QKY70372.1 hypothetical protein Len3610_12885 [Lentibacillus sp. CBA3610]
MKNKNVKKVIQCLLFVSLLLVFPLTGLAEESPEGLPVTGFEESNGDEWTTHEEELAFLEDVANQSERMTYSQVGTSVEGKPLHLVRVGFPEPPTDEEIENGRNMLVVGSQHGNEPAGREMALQLLRDLAFTENPELLDQLSETTVLFIPSANPDGSEMDQRRNAEGMDINRDHLNLWTPEIQTVAAVMDQLSPDIVVDAHERPGDAGDPDMELMWPRNLNTDNQLRELSEEMVQDHVRPEVEEAGFTTGLYAPFSSTIGLETVFSQMAGLRHGIGLLTESPGMAEPESRVQMQKRTVESVLEFYRDNFDEIADTVSGAPDRKAADGADQEPFYLDGADNREPPEWAILDPAACGYLLHTAQADDISRHIELFSLETEKVSENGVFVTMNQPMMTVVPFLMDERANYSMVAGLALDDCSDPGSIDPPDIPEQSEPAQYETDFSEYEVGQTPGDWSTMWRESRWTVLDEPNRLEHVVVGADGGSKALTWDQVGEVYGDVELSGVVRADGVSNTMFQLAFHMSGEADSTNGYYLDMRHSDASSSANRVRINSWIDGGFTQHSTAELPFTALEDTWYEVVIQREGNRIRAKTWPYGEEEPDAFQVTHIDDTLNHGKVGLVHFTGGTVNEWAFFSVGTGGESAARAPENLFDPEVDKTELQNRIDEINAEELNEENYTEESWEALEQALADAETVLNNEDATQAEVDAALEALNDARSGLEEIEGTPISAHDLITSVENFAEDGAFENDQTVRSLTMHLTSVSRYEEQEEAEKVLRHMESFKQLLDYQQTNDLISGEAYEALNSDAESLIEKWQ